VEFSEFKCFVLVRDFSLHDENFVKLGLATCSLQLRSVVDKLDGAESPAAISKQYQA